MKPDTNQSRASKAKAGADAEATPDVPDAKTGEVSTTPISKPDLKPDTKPNAKAGAKPHVKTDPKDDLKTVPLAEVEKKLESSPEGLDVTSFFRAT